jgi:hypothetical protein
MPKPPKPGQVKVSTMKLSHAKQHLAMMVEHTNTVKDYGAHGTGYSSGGGLTGSGMSGSASGGADYMTTNEGLVGDSDSGGGILEGRSRPAGNRDRRIPMATKKEQLMHSESSTGFEHSSLSLATWLMEGGKSGVTHEKPIREVLLRSPTDTPR